MARQWGVREANSFEVECAYCHTKFWTTSGIKKYCSGLCLKQATKKNIRVKRAKTRPVRVKARLREETEGLKRKKPEPRWDLSRTGEGSVAYFYNHETASISMWEDPGDYFRVETDLDDILSLFKGGIVYGRFAELRGEADPFKLMVASLDRAINGVSPKNIKIMRERILWLEEHDLEDGDELVRIRRQPEPTGEETWHGTGGGYNYHKCRCDRCSEAQRVINRAYNQRKKEELHKLRAELSELRAMKGKDVPNQDH